MCENATCQGTVIKKPITIDTRPSSTVLTFSEGFVCKSAQNHCGLSKVSKPSFFHEKPSVLKQVLRVKVHNQDIQLNL